MTQRLLVGIAAVVVVVLAAYAFFVLRPSTMHLTQAPHKAMPYNPLGNDTDPNDPGEQHYAQGRYPEAIAYWMQAASEGDPNAAHRLGVEYMDGKPSVVLRDYAKALQYHRQAAAAGNMLSMFDIGTMYEYGYGVPKDIAQSAKWYGNAARYGLAQGQYNFATMLEVGEGVPKDEVEAYKFFILAARGGFSGVPYDNQRLRIDRNAPLPTQLLERRLSRQQVEDGRMRADTFKVASGPLNIE